MVQVCFIDGEPVPVDLAGASSLGEVRWRVASVLGISKSEAPGLLGEETWRVSPENVELLDEAGQRLDDFLLIEDLGDMKIQTFIFGLPVPEPEEEDQWPPTPTTKNIEEDDATKLYDSKMSGLAMNFESPTTCASSEQADSPSASFPLHEAVILGDCDAVVQLLDDGADIRQRDAEGDTVLHRAAYQGRRDLVSILLGARADVDVPDRKGKTALRRAYDSKDVTDVLLAGGADPSIGDKNGNTALHRAAEDDHADVATTLLAASGDPNLLSDDDLSPIHTAAIFGKVDVLKVLLGAGGNVNAKGSDGNTALHFAAYGGREAVGKVLLGAGAEPETLNDDGETPLEHASTGDHALPAWLLECVSLDSSDGL